MPGAFLAAYVEAARSCEIDPYIQLRRRRLPTHSLEDEDVSVRLDELLALVDHTASVTGRADFPFRLAAALNLAALPLVMLAGAQSSVREAVGVFCAHAVDSGSLLRATLLEERATATLQLAPAPGGRRRPAESELALALMLRALQGLIGPGWRPSRTEFAHRAPADAAPYETLFGAVDFGQDEDAMTFPRSVLERPCPLRSPVLIRLLELHLGLDGRVAGADFADQARDAVQALLPRGLCSADRVAAQLGVVRRTVHRRLAERGLSFSGLELAARRRIAEAELADPRRSIATVARRVGISSASCFSRWFRTVYGQSPRAFRKALLNGADPSSASRLLLRQA